mgnify:CR=1 FL=1
MLQGIRSCVGPFVLIALIAVSPAATAATKTWDGGAGTSSWHDAANWSPDGVPGAGDDVVLSGAITVAHSVGTSSIASLSLTFGTLVVSGGALEVEGLFDVVSGTLDYTGGVVDAAVRLRSSSLLKIGPAATAPFAAVVNGNATLLGRIHPGQSVLVQGSNAFASSTLTLADGSSCAGTLTMESINSTWNSDLFIPAAAEFTIEPGGVLLVAAGTGGPRTFGGTGDLRNEGQIAVQAGVTATMNGAGRSLENFGTIAVAGGLALNGPNVTLAAGSLAGTAPVLVVNGSISALGGAIGQPPIVRSCAITIGPTFTGTVIAEGGNTLLDQASPTATLWVRGSNAGANATLGVAEGAANAGIIRLESIDSTWASNLSIPAGSEFVNGEGALVDVILGAGGPRSIVGAGNLRNDGQIAVSAGTTLTFNGLGRTLANHGSLVVSGGLSLNEPTLSLVAGSLAGSGTSLVLNGWLEAIGGAIGQPPIVRSCAITIGPTFTGTVIAEGGNTLLDQASPTATLWVRGSNAGANATLGVAEGAANAGIIRLESIDSTWASNLSIPAGSEFVNGEGALVDVILGAGGPRSIVGAGNLRNDGQIAVSAGTTLTFNGLGRTLANHGSLVVSGGLSLNEPTLSLVAGSLAGSGTSLVLNGWLEAIGGAIGQPPIVRSCAITIGPTFTGTVIAEGGNTLLDQASPTATLWVRGSNAGANATLGVAEGAANAGIIRLESIDTSWSSVVSIPAGSTFTNLAGGSIVAKAGTGGARQIGGPGATFINQGTIEPSYPNHLAVLGNYTQTASGTLATEYAGPASSQHSRLNVTGVATLAGAIGLTRVGGYAPAAATVHTFLDSAGRVGVFETVASCDNVTVTYNATQAAVQFTVSGVFGDLNGDGTVDGADLGLLLGAWGSASCGADLNGDGTVNGADLGLLLGAWG